MGHEPGFLVGRLHDLPGTTLDRLTAHWRGLGGFVEGTPDGSWAIVFVLIFSLLVLLPRGSRGGVSVAPALILFLALGAAVVVNPLALDHQLDSSVDRFLAQVLPLLVLAACARIFGSSTPTKTETPSPLTS